MAPGRTWAIVAGGGTAGHVLPAVAVARALVERGHAADTVHFVGSRRGVEARLVPEAGFSITLLPGRGIARSLTLDNVGAVLGLLVAVVRGVILVARRKPAVVLAMGGYAAVPCAVAAVLLRVPLVLHDQNAVPGLANRLAGRFARAAAVSFPGTALPRAEVTGNPVRPEVAAVQRTPAARAAARQQLGLPEDRVVVAAFGGSLGARTINRAVAGLAAAWSMRDDVVLYHVVGRRDWDDPQLRATTTVSYRPVEYEERMPLLLAAADVAVCRAGGTTVAELAVVELPAVLVPLPGAPGDHQTANAGALVQAGGAVLVPDGELTTERLAAELA
ncbi:MAG TPA: UDP-N-acetylglucosamine--N-acetylmuramyl-(pentapeptide) pyrophosphoryl-undecaprenol N-acetylglucosamine transferase, partial [Acidimicrobiales bacterium]|nr:UDP-N-acetylglucosamine--N-acetylmuramyl-(pentapeptide) pyrophosphoryl-undecaprenol N-acetylglucosamine transferase [Acidimicrobiales bacterium]